MLQVAVRPPDDGRIATLGFHASRSVTHDLRLLGFGFAYSHVSRSATQEKRLLGFGFEYSHTRLWQLLNVCRYEYFEQQAVHSSELFDSAV